MMIGAKLVRKTSRESAASTVAMSKGCAIVDIEDCCDNIAFVRNKAVHYYSDSSLGVGSNAGKKKLGKAEGNVSKKQPQKDSYHSFTGAEIEEFRKNLLEWFYENHRTMPWRELSGHKKGNLNEDDVKPIRKRSKVCKSEGELSQRAYEVWVSEVMLQQTQVATVIPYYNKWLKEFPTVKELSRSTLEDVTAVWSGLGYYSRARRLHEGATKVMEHFSGIMPDNMQGLKEKIPGVGPYTAGAIASIAYREPVGVVDGNVMRVLSRMRSIGAVLNTSFANELFWDLAHNIVCPEHPGDFNQAVMELGATICSPTNPQCSSCPVRTLCRAHEEVRVNNSCDGDTFREAKLVGKSSCPNEGNACKACIPIEQWPSPGEWAETIYPVKAEKKKAREEAFAVAVLCNKNGEYLMIQRKEDGLLGGLWEFPCFSLCNSSESKTELIDKFIEKNSIGKTLLIGSSEVKHVFSHVHATYLVDFRSLKEPDKTGVAEEIDSYGQKACWVKKEDMTNFGISTAMKKVLKSLTDKKKKPQSKKVKAKDSSQRSIADMFTRK
eukprot:Nk52_evm60s210 gene=Nk52_evmTU60s210